MDIKIKDRNKEVEYLRISCNIAELQLSYLQADLILRVQKMLNVKKGDFNVKDAVQINQEWKDYWTEEMKKD